MFKSCYFNKPSTVPVKSGTDTVPVYSYVIDEKTGREELRKTGEDCIYLKTQEARPDDIYTLLKNSGVESSDIESLKVTAQYSEQLIDDFTAAPRTLMEAHNVIHRAHDSFLKLPLDVREEFGNDPGNMLSSLVDGSFEKRVSRFYPVNKTAEEVIDNAPAQ